MNCLDDANYFKGCGDTDDERRNSVCGTVNESAPQKCHIAALCDEKQFMSGNEQEKQQAKQFGWCQTV